MSDPLGEIVLLLFAPEEQAEAAGILTEGFGEDFLATGAPRKDAVERIRTAALKVSAGDLGRLRRAVTLARQDWRDLLVAAGFEEHPQAHEEWAETVRR